MEEMLGGARITYLGQSTFRFTTAGDEQIIIEHLHSVSVALYAQRRIEGRRAAQRHLGGGGIEETHHHAARESAVGAPRRPVESGGEHDRI